MMRTKLLFQRFFASLLLLAASSLSWAYDFEEGGIYYNITGTNSVEVTTIGGWNFYSGDVTIPATVTHEAVTYNVTAIGYSAFNLSTDLESVTIPGSVTSIGIAAFMYCAKLTTVNIPESVTSIGDGAFSNCTGLTTVNIPESVTSIGVGAFQNCTSLPAIDCVRYADTYLVEATDKSQSTYAIKEGTRFIGYEAFSGCTNLTDVVIPNSVTYIDQYAFYGCTSLTQVYSLAVTPPVISHDNTFSNRANATLYVPVDSKSAYEAATFWKDFKEIKEPQHVDVTIPAAETRTFCSYFDLDFSEVSDLKAYIISGFSPSTGTLTLTRVTDVPAGTGLLLRGEAGNYEVPVQATDMYYSNMLKGVNEAIMLAPTEGDYTNFILSSGSHGIGFYPVSETAEFAAGKAYLQMPTAKVPALGDSGARCFILDFENEEATGIGFTKATAPQEDGVYYDLTGRRVEKPSKGFYIMNGKKMFIQ